MMHCEECGRDITFSWRFWRHVREHHPETTKDDWEFAITDGVQMMHGSARIKRTRPASAQEQP